MTPQKRDHYTYVWADSSSPRVLKAQRDIARAVEAGQLHESPGTPDTKGKGPHGRPSGPGVRFRRLGRWAGSADVRWAGGLPGPPHSGHPKTEGYKTTSSYPSRARSAMLGWSMYAPLSGAPTACSFSRTWNAPEQ